MCIDIFRFGPYSRSGSDMKKAKIEIVRDLSSILAGFNLAVIVIKFIGVGSLARWVIEKWYPTTRWLWNNVFSYLDLPQISDIEKDALTAMVFFLPLGIIAIIYRIRRIDKGVTNRTKVISLSLGALFIYLMCKNLINFVIYHSNLDPKLISILIYYAYPGGQNIYPLGDNVILALALFVILIYTSIAIGILSIREPKNIRQFTLEKIERQNRAIYKIYLSTLLSLVKFVINTRSTRGARIIMFTIMTLLYWGAIVYLLATLDSYISILILLLIVASVVLSALFAPKKLILVAGAALAFVGAAYLYEGAEFAVEFIESVAIDGN